MMPAESPEVDLSINLRAERRKQELLDAMKQGAGTSMPLDVECATQSTVRDANKFLEGGLQKDDLEDKVKESISSPMKGKFVGLYPVKPPRSVYNSPLISKNQDPLWKNSPLIFSEHEMLQKLTPKPRPLIYIPNTYYYYHQSLPSQEENNEIVHSLYPSLPKSETGSSLLTSQGKVTEKFDSHHTTNFAQEMNPEKLEQEKITANSVQPFDLPCTSSWENLKEDPESPLASSSFMGNEDTGFQADPNISSWGKEALQSPKNEMSADDIQDTFEMDQFLEEALGSQLYDDATISSDKWFGSLDRGSDPLYSLCCYGNLKKTIGSDPTLSSTSTKCVTLPRIPNESYDDRVEMLLVEADKQQQVMMQASKALSVCRSTEAFSSSLHLVDGERVLLLASLRRQAALKEIQIQPPRTEFEFKGDLHFFDIIAPVKLNHVNAERSGIRFHEHFICVISCREQVIATKVVTREMGADCIRFSDILKLSDLSACFLATLQIFTFKVPISKESSKHNNLQRVYKLLRMQNKSHLCLKNSSDRMLLLRTPAFALSGTAKFSLCDIDQLQENQLLLEKVPLMSPLQGIVKMKVTATLKNTSEISGFIDKLEERRGCRAWQRRWCNLSGLRLCFWNYPADQDYKSPIEIIDLRACIMEKVEPAPRSFCARARTVMLETRRAQSLEDMNSTLVECNHNHTLERHFLSYDSTSIMNQWIYVINQNLSSILTWKLPHV